MEHNQKKKTVKDRMLDAIKVAVQAPDAPKVKKVVRKGKRIDITFR